MKHMLSLLGFLLVLCAFPLVHAHPFTASIDGPSDVSLLEGTSVSIPLFIQNNDFKPHKVTITSDVQGNFVDVIPSIKTFTLSPYESTTIGLTVRASDDSDHDLYEALVTVEQDGQFVSVPLNVYVGNNPFLTMTTFDSVVCANEYVESISVFVENRTSEEMTVKLKAEDSILFPYTKEESVTLDAGEEKFVTFNVNVSPLNVGKYEGIVLAETPTLVMVRPFKVTVNECPVLFEKTISLKVPTKIYNLPKLQTTLVPITVTNLTDEPRFVEFFMNSSVPGTINSLTIAPNDVATVNIAFAPTIDTPSGKQNVNLTAVSGGYQITQSFTVNVVSMDALELTAVDSIFTIAKGETREMEFIVTNKGDSTQTVSLNVQGSASDVDFAFNPSQVILTKGSSAVVVLSISVSSNTSVTSVNTNIVATGKTTATLPLNFTIVETEPSFHNVLKFVNFPTELTMNRDAQKEMVVSITNLSDESISNVRFKLTGVANAHISVVGPPNTTWAPHETKTVTLTFVTQEETLPGVYSPILIAEGTTGFGSVPLSLRVNDGFGSGLLTGLVSFVGERAGVLGVFILFVLAMVYIFSQSHKKSPVWTSKAN